MGETAFLIGMVIAQHSSKLSSGPLIKPDERLKKAIDDFVWELNKPWRDLEADILQARFNGKQPA